MIFSKQATLLVVGTFTTFASFSARAVEGHIERGLQPPKKQNSKTSKRSKNTNAPTFQKTDAPTTPKDPKTNPIDKTILTCDAKSQPTFCESPDASIDCQTLTDRMNLCIDQQTPEAPFVVYDPNNCGTPGAEVIGCKFGGASIAEGNCRACGPSTGSVAYESCAFGFYADYYEPKGGQPKSETNQRSTNDQTISDMLGVPVQVDCDKYYKTLEGFQVGPSETGVDVIGDCFLDSESFEIPFFQQFFPGVQPQVGGPIFECPPQLAADFSAYGGNARYQKKTTVNNMGVTYPKVDDPALAVGPVPARLPVSEFDKKCEALALGQEINIFDAGEISTFALTAKTMAARMLRPAAFAGGNIINCVEVQGQNLDTSRCGDYAANTVENPTTYTNSSELPVNNAGFFPGVYEHQVPSASRPLETSDTHATDRVAKQMHGKGQSCVFAEFSMAPLKALYAKNLKSGDFGYIPEERRVGLLDPKLANNDVTFDTLVRLAGNKNITDIKDVHDVRIRGFGLKLFGVQSAFEKYQMEYNQIWLPVIPAFDQPENGQYTFGNFNFESEQEVGSLDLTHVAIGTGELLGTGGQALNDTFFDPTTELGARNPPDNVFVASNVDNYYNGFILGGDGDITNDSLTNVYQNPLEYVYGTAAPFRAGPAASMKLSWAACPGEHSKITKVYTDLAEAFKDSDFFYTNLKDTLKNDFKMCGYMQFQENTCTEPLENPTTRWLTDNIKVFELKFPAQYVPTYNSFCDNTVITPWRTIQEHQPQSFINRVRMVVYVYAWQYRLILNNGVQKSKGFDSTGKVTITDDLGQNTCPYRWNEAPASEGPRFEGTALNKKPDYQGPVFKAYSQTVVIDPATGIIPDPKAATSAGICQADDECMLPFGPGSKCEEAGCNPTNSGLYPYEG